MPILQRRSSSYESNSSERLVRVGTYFEDFQRNGDGWKARCPVHDDSTPSLSISEGQDGRILLHCHAGCETSHVLRAVGLSFADLGPGPHIVATYDYRDATGELRYQVVRYEPKGFRQRCPKFGGGWQWSVKDVQRVLYRLPELLAAKPSMTVFVVEGEKDADRLAKLGLVATTSVGGAGKWHAEYNQYLAGRKVVVLPDNDEPGRDHAQRVAASLRGVAASVKVLALPGLPPKGDVSDWLDKGGTPKNLMTLAAKAPEHAGGTYRECKGEGIPGTYRKFKQGDIAAALASLKSRFRRHYYYSDDTVIDLVLGVVAGNHLDSDPLWIHLISAPSGGKTELLYAIFGCDQTYFLSDFTAAALISGYKDPLRDSPPSDDPDAAGDETPSSDSPENDYSLLPKLDGKVVVTKDFSVIHDKPSETRAQILSILRDVYDGYASRALGNCEPKGYHARFNYLTGMTPDIEKSWSLNTLGERFLMYRIGIEDRREHARRSLRNANKSASIRAELQQAVKEFVGRIPKSTPSVGGAMEDRILDLADLLSTCRTYVHRERNDDLICLPQAELASRVAKQLLRVGQSVSIVRGKLQVTDEEFLLMKRIALDSLPTNRRQLLAVLWAHRAKPEPLQTFQDKVSRLAKNTIRRELDNLFQLGVVTRSQIQRSITIGKKPAGATRKDVFHLSKTFTRYCENVGGIPPC